MDRTGIVLATLVAYGAALLALGVPESIFSRVLFAWHAIGSAFGPALLILLLGRRLNSLAAFLAINTGFLATVILHWFPDGPGDVLERGLPFVLSLAIVMVGSRPARRT